MADIDKETLDYLRGNLEREVRENVEGRLFRYWIALSAAFLGGVGLVGVPWALSYLDGKITTAVEAKVEAVTVTATERAKQLSVEAQQIAQEARDDVRSALTDIDTRRTIAQDQLVAMRAQADRVGDQFTDLRTEVEEARGRLGEIEDRANQQSDRLRNAVPDAGQIATLVQDFRALVEQVSKINAELAELRTQTAVRPAEAADVQLSQQLTQQLTQLEQSSQQRIEQAQSIMPETTVYLQFAQLTRENAKALSSQLRDANWKLPGEERLDSAEGLREIRCYYEDDCTAAVRLKADVEEALARLGFGKVEIGIKSLLDFSPKPRQGVMELWLGLENPPKA